MINKLLSNILYLYIICNLIYVLQFLIINTHLSRMARAFEYRFARCLLVSTKSLGNCQLYALQKCYREKRSLKDCRANLIWQFCVSETDFIEQSSSSKDFIALDTVFISRAYSQKVDSCPCIKVRNSATKTIVYFKSVKDEVKCFIWI